MIYQTYTRKHVSRFMRAAMGATKCGSFNYAVNPPKSIDAYIRSSKSADVIKGDMKTATPYEADIIDLTPMSGTYYGVNRVYYKWGNHLKNCGASAGLYDTVQGDVGYYFPIPVVAYPEDLETEQFLMDYSRTQALADVRKNYVNIPLLYAERRETLGMVAKRSKQVLSEASDLAQKSVARYKNTPLGKRKQVARDLANVHLEALFGWLPIMQEIQGAIDLASEPKTMLITGRGRRALQSDVAETQLQTFGDATTFLDKNDEDPSLSCAVTGFDRFSSRSSFTYEVTSHAMKALRSLGFNPLSTAFDLVPLSFVGNFFSNVGDWVAAHDPIPGLTYIRGSTGLWREAKRDYVVTPYPYDMPIDSSMWCRSESYSALGVGASRRLHVKRFVFSHEPGPTIHFADNMTFAKAITASALVVQRSIKPLKMLSREVKPFRYRGPRPKYLPPIKWKGKTL